jgi:hypothetical protein
VRAVKIGNNIVQRLLRVFTIFRAQKDVLRLDVAVDETQAMHLRDARCYRLQTLLYIHGLLMYDQISKRAVVSLEDQLQDTLGVERYVN